MGPCSVHWIHSGCVVVLTLCNLFSDAPFSHVFSSESSSIDIVRLGQSCQRLFFNQKPALSNCSLSCTFEHINRNRHFCVPFFTLKFLWTNSSCLVGIVLHLVGKMVRVALWKLFAKIFFCAGSKIEILNTVLHFTLRSAGTVVLWRMLLCDTFRTWAMSKTSGECVTLAALLSWCNNLTALVLTRSGYLLAVAGASTTSLPHKGRYIFGGRTFSLLLQKRRRLNRSRRFCFHCVYGVGSCSL